MYPRIEAHHFKVSLLHILRRSNSFALFLFLVRVVEILLKKDSNVCLRDHQGYNAAHYAAVNGHKLALEMVGLHS